MNISESDIARFNSKFTKNENECWIWTAGTRKGYGLFWLSGKDLSAHRVSWIIKNGEIPKCHDYHGMCVLHKCDTPLCVNPDHLFTGTNADNLRDRDEKGRQASHAGESHGQAKLTNDGVLSIRLDSRPPEEVAKDFGISYSQVLKIKKRRAWRHI